MIGHEKNDLDKKWTWYIYEAAHFLLFLAIAITWILTTNKNILNNQLMIPTIVCNIISVILVVVFVYYESRNIASVSMHINKKWIKFFFASLIIYVAAIMSSIIFYLFRAPGPNVTTTTMMICDICICAFLNLLSLGLYRYARFKIDLEMYRRKRGIIIKQEEEALLERKQKENLSDEEFNKIKAKKDKSSATTDGIDAQATSGFTKHVDQKQ